eukprot:3389858-Pyramimonas_sp.AAC.1
MALEAPDQCAMCGCCLANRIAVQQGLRAGGAVEAGAEVVGQLSCDGVEFFVVIFRAFQRETGGASRICQVDVDSACRLPPLRPADRWAATSVLLRDGAPAMSSHIGLPFGPAAPG